MVIKTLRQEREKRDDMCRAYFGTEYEYPVEDDFYEKYRVLNNFKNQVPFMLEDCKPFDPSKLKKDELQRYFKGVRTKHQCEDIMHGIWSPTSVNRENLVDSGVCFVREKDRYCSKKHDNNGLVIQAKRGKRGFIWPSSLRRASEGCINDKKCEWVSKSFECVSRETMETLEEFRIPELPSNWPKDITTSDIQEYLRRYYLKAFEEKPQSFMPVFGKGNRCIGYEKKKISQAQTVVNMLFRGMVHAEKNGTGSNRGLLVWHGTGSGKCMAKDSEILMYDGTIKLVQNIAIGDELMGDDSGKRVVQSLGRGQDTMYEITGWFPGYKYTVNSEHILCLKRAGEVVHIEVRNYVKLPADERALLKGYVTDIEFQKQHVDKDPYEYGMSEKQRIDRRYLINTKSVRWGVFRGVTKGRMVIYNEKLMIKDDDWSNKMLEDVLFLVRSLGMICWIDGKNIVIAPLLYARDEMDIKVKETGLDDYYGFTIDKNHRYVLGNFVVTHNTCTATGVMDAFWDTDKEIVFASTIEALASNPPEAFMDCAVNLFPRFKQEHIRSNIKAEFDKRGVHFFTFAQLAHYLLINKPLKVKKEDEEKHKGLLKNAILIIDEVHNIFKPLPHQKSEHFALRDFLMDVGNPLTKNLHIAVLTATPGDNINEIADLLNLVRDRKSLPIKAPKTEEEMKQFGKSIKGLVSYLNNASDLSKYPLVKKMEPHIAPMTMIQYKKYIEAFNGMSNDEKSFDKLAAEDKVDRYYKPARKYSNSLFNMEKKMTINEFSSKLPILLQQIKKYPREKHFVYSTFFENRGFGGHGVLAIAHFLEKEMGYEKVEFTTARGINQGNKPMLSVGKKRFMLAITNELAGNRQFSTGDNLKELVNLFNRVDNKNGEYVHVFLASQKFNEGVDFKGLRHIHMFEPFLMFNKEVQTIGRGARYCSHKDLSIENGEWVVNIHKYIADFPSEVKAIDVDTLKTKMANIKIDIVEEEKKIADVKGKRGKEFSDVRDLAKKNVVVLKSDLAAANKQNKELESIDPKKYFMIDQKIEEEVRERIKTQLLLLTAMKMYAVDCKLFRDFHGRSGDVYDCRGSLI
jgi:hypothetical protein